MLLNMEINKNFHQKYLKFLGMFINFENFISIFTLISQKPKTGLKLMKEIMSDKSE